MVGKGSPRFNMSSSPKLCRYMPTTSATKKKPSPKCSGARKSGGSPRAVKKRADWNPALERSLVEILHEFKDSGYRGDNGWNSEGWNRMVKEFHVRNKYVSFTKTQIQDKEGQLKKDYKMLKAAKDQSGSSWNYERHMVEGTPAMWENLMVSFPKIKKFNNNKASFPLFDALGELYDGHLAEGNYNFTSLEAPQEEDPLVELLDVEAEPQGLDEAAKPVTERDEEVLEVEGGADIMSRDDEREAPTVERTGQRRPAAVRSKKEKELKRPMRNENITSMMGAFLEMRSRQLEDEAADRAREREARERETREKDAAQGLDFSIRRCISVLNTMEVTKEEKAKGYEVFIKSIENREAFVSACEVDREAALFWLKSKMV